MAVLAVKFFQFDAELFVFGFFAGDEFFGQTNAFLYPAWREDVAVGKFVVAAREALGFDQPLGHDGFEHVVGFADAEAQLSGQRALVWLVGRVFERQQQGFGVKCWLFHVYSLRSLPGSGTIVVPVFLLLVSCRCARFGH